MNKLRFDSTNKLIVSLYRSEIEDNSKTVANLQSYLTTLREAVNEIRSNVEPIQVKEKTLEKAFKKDFNEATPVVQEQAARIYK